MMTEKTPLFKTGLLCLLAFASLQFLVCRAAAQNKRPNVLFIAVDDLRPNLGCYGMKTAITPNIDKLASEGRLFTHHYVAVPTCGASRQCLLTGRLPHSKIETKNEAPRVNVYQSTSHPQTMPELFKRNGYETFCIGKISHSSDGWKNSNASKDSTNYHVPFAWTKVLTPRGSWKGSLVVAYPNGVDRSDDYLPLMQFPEMEDNEMPDGMFAEKAVEQLKRLSKTDKPFFFALGFVKPHLPFVAPKKYWEMYKGVDFPSPNGMKRGDTKKGTRSGEFYKYVTNRGWDTPKNGETLPEDIAQEVRRAYMACATYTDTQIGKVLAALKVTGLDKNTIVVLWGDHGWHLGENNVWGKHTPLDMANHSPLIIKIPSQKMAGVKTHALASTIDLFPTLMELCKLPSRQTYKPIEGKSLVPVLQNPDREVRNEALSFWGNNVSITDGNYRLIVSPNRQNTAITDYELYDHSTDVGELHNIARQKPQVVSKLMKQIKAAYPQGFVK